MKLKSALYLHLVLNNYQIFFPEGGFKKDSSGNVILTKLDEASLKSSALATKGAYIRSTSGDMDLDFIYRKGIRKSVADKDYGMSR